MDNVQCSENEKITEILNLLAQYYPDAGTSLVFQTPFELLVAAILSAQCTDKQVNRITARLFKKYNKPQDFARLTPEELAEEIKGCGLYRNKSRFIIESAREIVQTHGGRVPMTRSELETLPGVGRKTAGVIIGVAYGGSALPVDTHVFRVARRLGLSAARDPVKVEGDLAACVQPEERMPFHHRLIFHGREICSARKPSCYKCCLKNHCSFYASGSEPS
ncbi:endonuclease III [Pelotomaculum propionicicum]|uniref:endonuclease III n=1 Tax=Pelotomaculum propionicicum TaxID=258475 RepID=UPI003B76FC10